MNKTTTKRLREQCYPDFLLILKRNKNASFKNFFRHVKRLYNRGEVALGR